MRTEQTNQIADVMPAVEGTIPASGSIVEPFDHDAYVIAQVHASRAAKFDLMFAQAMRETDWRHESLTPYRSQIDQVLGWRHGSKGLLLTGPTGRGKSRSMVGLLKRLMQTEGRDVSFYKSSDFFWRLQGAVSYGRDEAAGWVRAVAQRPVVFIDDFGQEAVLSSRAEWSQGWFFDFCDQRIEAKLPLFLTTNMGAREIAANAGFVRGDPLLRRLLELCEVVKF
jgi:DNA replication protein DnaC